MLNKIVTQEWKVLEIETSCAV